MSNKSVKTTTITGGAEYARVPARLKEFRADCPNGHIETVPTIMPDGQVMFRAYIVKDKSKKNSADATGHSIGMNKGVKAFEKLETVAVGRALANLGYLASGEIASSEEMELFNEYQEEKVQEAIGKIKATDSIESLKELFMSLGSMMANAAIIKAKDAKKKELLAPKPKPKPKKVAK